MGDNLVIVESPAKAKTIEKILGQDFIVKSSFGHIRDLPKKGLGIDIEGNFEPDYEVSPDKKSVVSELKSLSKRAKKVWLASDEDREGESIAWHLSQELKLDPNDVNRIVFHEITSSAIKRAIENPRSIDINLVNAQQARRVLDRLVGFELSPLLWKRVRPSLSAGRVQSVAVRLIVEREREIIAFKGASYYKVTALFTAIINNKEELLKTELNKKFSSYEEAKSFIESCDKASFTVDNVEKKPGKRSPSAPFTTSTLQQEASRRLGFSVSQTMRVAQTLYESGLITYMRTDSMNLSKEAVASISRQIAGAYGDSYVHNRKYTTSAKGAQEAHEAIRPTYADRREIEGSAQEKRLYSLIWRRAVASQMADAKIERTIITISNNNNSYNFVAKGEVITFDGFLKVYEGKGDDEFLPNLKAGDTVQYSNITSTESFEQRPSRYSEASLVRQLEELGIGRPSTYAPTISTIINRGYVVKEDREGLQREYKVVTLNKGEAVKEDILKETYGSEKSKLFPTDIGIIVTDYLLKHFVHIMDYNFTASVEREFDDIAEGELDWHNMLAKFYGEFHSVVETANSEEGGFISSEQRLIGVDPKSGKNVYARMGRFGAMVQIGESDDEDKKYAGLKGNMLLETVTLEQALELFSLPRNVGEYEDKTVTIGEGRFGPYIRHNSAFVSIPKGYDPLSITLDEAIVLIEEKRKKEREKVLRVFDEDNNLQIHNGRWGAYIVFNGENYKAPKDVKDSLKDMSYDDVMKIVNTDGAKSNGMFGKKGAAKKSTTKGKTTTKDDKPKKSSSAKASTAKSSTTKASSAKRKTAPKTTKKRTD